MEKLTMLRAYDAAEYLGVAVASLAKWRVTGTGPAFFKIGASVRYRQTDLETWIESRRVQSTAEADQLRVEGERHA